MPPMRRSATEVADVSETRQGRISVAAVRFRELLAAATFFGVVGQAALASAAEYWIDPASDASGDGSSENPWMSLDQALLRAESGDTLWLRSGDYGMVSVSDQNFSPAVVVAAEDGSELQFAELSVSDSSGLSFRGLDFLGESARYLVTLEGQDLVVEECTLASTTDSSGWSAQDWIDRASGGINAQGTGITIRDNYLLNVGYGIAVSAERSTVERNTIENFSRDGLRGLGDHTVFQYNTVKNAYDVDDHHDDGFQSWSVGDGGVGTGEVVGITLRGNTFINYEDPDQPHRGTMQGIGCFDGTFVDWVVENNVIMTNHWHGITLLGARDSVVRNNTVIDLNTDNPGPPWISVSDHKDGTPPSGCVVANNLATDFDNADGVLEESNIVVGMDELDAFFVDADNHDVRLIEGAPAIDQGFSDAPEADRNGIPRPQGSAVDVGAHEWTDMVVDVPSEPGSDPAEQPGDAEQPAAPSGDEEPEDTPEPSENQPSVDQPGTDDPSNPISDEGSSSAVVDDAGGCSSVGLIAGRGFGHAWALSGLLLLLGWRRRELLQS